jgi:hypothetical protein
MDATPVWYMYRLFIKREGEEDEDAISSLIHNFRVHSHKETRYTLAPPRFCLLSLGY